MRRVESEQRIVSDEEQYLAAREFGSRFGGRLAEAVDFAIEKHGERRRVGGDLYFSHVVRVAKVLADEWRVSDIETLTATILHDVHEDEQVPLTELEQRFGPRVAYLVDGVSKYKSKEGQEGTDQETLQKVVQYSTDVAVLLIKLGDRLDNLRSLGAMPRERQIPKAVESLNAYVGWAETLGLWEVKTELEDLSFYYLDRDRYLSLLGQIEGDLRRDPGFVLGIQSRLQQELTTLAIKGVVETRFKGVWGTVKKQEKAAMEGKSVPGSLAYVPDLVSFRVILDEKQDARGSTEALCGYFLRHVSWEFREIFTREISRTDDYLSKPQLNGYQALHGVFKTLGGLSFEIAVTTREREDFNRYGVLSLIHRDKDLGEFKMLKIIFTPGGKVKFLPRKANGLDLATAIEPMLAMKARSWVEVGQEDVPHSLSEVVPHGKQIKILTDKPAKPSDWLLAMSLPETREKLTEAIVLVEQKAASEKGRKMLELVLRDRGFLSIEDLELVTKAKENEPLFTLLTTCGCQTVDNLCTLVGGGFLTVDRVGEILEELGVTKELGWSTLLVAGENQVGVLAELAGAFGETGINIIQEVNRVDIESNKYEIRVVFKDAAEEQLVKLRKLVEQGGFCERYELV